MKLKELLARLASILNDERHVQLEQYKSLKKVLKALKHEKKSLEESLDENGDGARLQDLETRLKIVSAQRKKGLTVLKSLKKERKQKTAP